MQFVRTVGETQRASVLVSLGETEVVADTRVAE